MTKDKEHIAGSLPKFLSKSLSDFSYLKLSSLNSFTTCSLFSVQTGDKKDQRTRRKRSEQGREQTSNNFFYNIEGKITGYCLVETVAFFLNFLSDEGKITNIGQAPKLLAIDWPSAKITRI